MHDSHQTMSGYRRARTASASSEPRLPDFLILGAQKAGTTALYYYLRHHPQVYMSRVKEPQFFAFVDRVLPAGGPGDAATDPVSTIENYRALFAGRRDETVAGEASTIYLYDDVAPRQIRHLLPDAKLIAILRDPAERAYSNFQHLRRDGREPLADFSEALAAEPERRRQGWSANWRYLDKGFYSVQVERYMQLFAPEQLMWVRYEDFDRAPERVVRDIYRFLGVDDSYVQDLSLRLNVAGVPHRQGVRAFLGKQERLKWVADPFLPTRLKHRLLKFQNANLIRTGMSPEVRGALVETFRTDIERLQLLTGLDCSDWLVA